MGFLIFKFPFIDVSSSPLLSWRFSNLFFKSRFYSYRPGFLSKSDISSDFNPLSVKTVQYAPKFPEIKEYQYVMGSKSMMRRRIRPEPYDIRKSWLVNPGKVFFDLMRKQGIGVSNYKAPKRYYFRWFRRPAWFRGYRTIAKELFLAPSQKPEDNTKIKPPYTYNLLNKGSLEVKRLSLKESMYDPFLYYRPEGADRETRKNSFLHTLFFPGGRSKFLLFRSKDPTADIIPFDNSTPTFKYPLMDYYFESKDNFEQDLNDDEFPPAIDDPISFSHFIEFSNSVPGGLVFDKEGFRAVDRYRVFNDLRASEKENIKSHNKLAADHPSLASQVGYRGYIRMWRALQFSIDRTLDYELYTGKEKKALFRRQAAARFDFYYRFAVKNEPWAEDLHFLSDEFERPRLWPADYVEDPAIQVSIQRGDSDFERGLRSKKRWGFFYDPRGYANLAPRGILDIVTKKTLNFLRSRAFFGNRKVVTNDSLPTYNFGGSVAARLIPYTTYDVHHYALFRMNSLLGYQQGTFINQYRIKQEPLSNSFKKVSKERDGLENPLISAKASISPIIEESALISKAYRQRIFVNKDLFHYMLYHNADQKEGDELKNPSDLTINNLSFIGLNSKFGFFISLLKGAFQFLLDQSFFLTTRLFAYFNALNKIPLYLYPVGGAKNKGEALYLNYYSIKLRLLYFFRKFFRVLFNARAFYLSPKFKQQPLYNTDSTEIDNFTFLAVKNSFISTALSSALLASIFFFNILLSIVSRVSEFFLIHPGIFVLCVVLVIIGFWRRLYPSDYFYSVIVEGAPYRSLARMRDFFKRKSSFLLNFNQGVGFFNDIFVDGSFSRNTGEDSFSYQTRLSKALGFIFSGISKVERPINNLFLKIGLKDMYDRTMINAYSPPESKSKNPLSLVNKLIPFPLRLRKGSLKGISDRLRNRVFGYYSKVKSKLNKDFLRVIKVWNKQKERLAHKTSNSVYRIRNWLNK